MSNYKIFKIITNQVFSFNFMSYLFSRNVFTQSFKLDLTKIWNHDYSKFIKVLHLMNTLYFSLVKIFLSIDEQIINDNNKNTRIVQNDFQYHNCHLFFARFISQNYLKTISQMKFIKLLYQHFFFSTINERISTSHWSKNIEFWQ